MSALLHSEGGTKREQHRSAASRTQTARLAHRGGVLFGSGPDLDGFRSTNLHAAATDGRANNGGNIPADWREANHKAAI